MLSVNKKPQGTLTTEELSEEDKRLQEELNMLMEKLTGKDTQLYHPALETLRTLIRTSTTSMTSVPRPLKYMSCHYNTLKDVYGKLADSKTRHLCAEIISVLAMAAVIPKAQENQRECLKFCLEGTLSGVGEWGHEYIRQLEGEIAEEWAMTPLGQEETVNCKLLPLISTIIIFDMAHNAEIQACDMVMEIDRFDLLDKHLDESNYSRVCLYLLSCAMYVEESKRITILKDVYRYYVRFREYARALSVAMQLNDRHLMEAVFSTCKDPLMRRQLAYMGGRQHVILEIPEEEEDEYELKNIMSNTHISDHFHNLARELDIVEPRSPEEIFKTWLEGTTTRPNLNPDAHVDSARHNLASSFVNAFVNAGFGRDKLITGEEGKNWIYRNKEIGMLSATASLGLIYLWDVDGGLSPIDRYLYTADDYIKSGALLALGIVNCGVRNDCEPAKALLMDYILHDSNTLRIGSVLGLGLAYAGSNREDVLSLLLPVVSDSKSTTEVMVVGALACGLVAVGTCNYDVTSLILQVLLEISEPELSNTYNRFLPLALGLCFLGRKDSIEATTAALEVLPDPFKSMSQTMLLMCAYAGTADVLIVQEMLHICSEHYEPEEKTAGESSSKESVASHCCQTGKEKEPEVTNKKSNTAKDLSSMQAVATLGVALIAMGEEIGSEMTMRIFGQLGRYGEPAIRRAVPLAFALTSISNPQLPILDVLNKLSHDSDIEVAQNAIFCMGLVGAGSNNARLATMLRQLAYYHTKNPGHLFMVRLAQGLIFLGKGTMSLYPFHSERQIMDPVAMAGLLIVLVSCLDTKNILLGKSHYLLYCLAAAMQPRWLITLNEEGESIPVTVRVGNAVDIIGKAGTPKTIAGMRTQTTPVVMAVGERAELATEEYETLTPVLEGFVMLRKKE
ncbi:26S proteasome non-ATPase regulatory subunit 2 [Anabrus simplex]|uniref:26S proteasome non-ATPase regulatory subunit 2 n=1 Tax=Anabrus simplex TaxID=316456 RepID=UPI0035A2852E